MNLFAVAGPLSAEYAEAMAFVISQQMTTTTSGYNENDWLNSDAYDPNGNTLSSAGNVYQYDALNRLTNVNNGAVLIGYDGDGNRVKKKVGGTTRITWWTTAIRAATRRWCRNSRAPA